MEDTFCSLLFILIYIIPREARPKAERIEVTNRVAFGQTTWLASPSKSSREFLYMYIYIYIYILKVSVRRPGYLATLLHVKFRH